MRVEFDTRLFIHAEKVFIHITSAAPRCFCFPKAIAFENMTTYNVMIIEINFTLRIVHGF